MEFTLLNIILVQIYLTSMFMIEVHIDISLVKRKVHMLNGYSIMLALRFFLSMITVKILGVI